MDGWNPSFLWDGLFSGAMLVSRRVKILIQNYQARLDFKPKHNYTEKKTEHERLRPPKKGTNLIQKDMNHPNLTINFQGVCWFLLGWLPSLKLSNIVPENRPLEKEILIGNHHLYGLCSFFVGVVNYSKNPPFYIPESSKSVKFEPPKTDPGAEIWHPNGGCFVKNVITSHPPPAPHLRRPWAEIFPKIHGWHRLNGRFFLQHKTRPSGRWFVSPSNNLVV